MSGGWWCILMACGYVGWVVLYFNGLWLRRVGGVVFVMACGYVGWVVLYFNGLWLRRVGGVVF